MQKRFETIGFMQGRLSPLVNNQIQAFPTNHWQQEFEIAANNGFQYIEWTIDDHNFYENPLNTDEGQIQIIELCEKHDIHIPSITLDSFMHRPYHLAQSAEERLYSHNSFNAILNACVRLDINTIVIPLVDNGSCKSKKHEFDLYNFLIQYVDRLEKNDIKVAFESDYSPEKLSDFINTYPKEFGINYDIGNSAALGYSCIDEFNSYSSRIINIHIKDRVYQGATVRLGHGSVDWRVLCNLIRIHNYTGNLILQTARSDKGDHLEELLLNRDFFLKQVTL